LALRALANIKPNLTISSSDITFSNQTPTRGETVTVTAAIHNTGPATAENIFIRFFDGDPSAGGVQFGADRTIQAIDPYSSATVNVAFNTSGLIGRHAIFVVADPMNIIDEAAEIDNIALNFVTINTLPDIFVNNAEITYTPVNPTPDVPLNITFIVRNLGETGLQNVLTKLYNSLPGDGGVAIDSYTIKTLGGKGVYGVIATIYSPTPGVNTFYLMADPDNTVSEANESNNVGSVTVVVGFPKDNDLSIYPSNISFSRPPGAKPGDSFTINAVVSNTGSANIATDVAFFNGDPASGGVLIGKKTITVPAIGTQLAQMAWTIPPDSTIIYVVVDPDNVIPEADKANNIAYRGL
jgi:subtilase family serine protease